MYVIDTRHYLDDKGDIGPAKGPARKPADDLETFLKRQDPSTLVGVLIELSNDHQVVQARLAR